MSFFVNPIIGLVTQHRETLSDEIFLLCSNALPGYEMHPLASARGLKLQSRVKTAAFTNIR